MTRNARICTHNLTLLLTRAARAIRGDPNVVAHKLSLLVVWQPADIWRLCVYVCLVVSHRMRFTAKLCTLSYSNMVYGIPYHGADNRRKSHGYHRVINTSCDHRARVFESVCVYVYVCWECTDCQKNIHSHTANGRARLVSFYVHEHACTIHHRLRAAVWVRCFPFSPVLTHVARTYGLLERERVFADDSPLATTTTRR